MEKIGALIVLAIVMSISTLAYAERECRPGDNCSPVMDMGKFETGDFIIKFPAAQDTNIDSLVVGNDKARAYGSIFMRTPKATATNNLEIKNDQDSGACPNQCCMNTLSSSESTQAGPVVLQTADCADCCIKVNVDQIKVGNRDALAFGFSSATNDVKILATQQ